MKCEHEYDHNGECLKCDEPMSEWVGLTDEEVNDVYNSLEGDDWILGGIKNALSFYDAIEAKLKQKNT